MKCTQISWFEILFYTFTQNSQTNNNQAYSLRKSSVEYVVGKHLTKLLIS